MGLRTMLLASFGAQCVRAAAMKLRRRSGATSPLLTLRPLASAKARAVIPNNVCCAICRSVQHIVQAIAEGLSVQCERGHRHVHLISGQAKAAQICPVKMCEAIIKGLRMWMHKKEDGQRQHILDFTRNDLCEPMEAQLIKGG